MAGELPPMAGELPNVAGELPNVASELPNVAGELTDATAYPRSATRGTTVAPTSVTNGTGSGIGARNSTRSTPMAA